MATEEIRGENNEGEEQEAAMGGWVRGEGGEEDASEAKAEAEEEDDEINDDPDPFSFFVKGGIWPSPWPMRVCEVTDRIWRESRRIAVPPCRFPIVPFSDVLSYLYVYMLYFNFVRVRVRVAIV